jgi:hypothetical protein
MEKLDLAKKYKTYFTAKAQPQLVQIEKASFISICGKGDPSGEPFKKNIEALYSIAYTLKFTHKEKNEDFVVSKLEGLWWFDEKKYAGKTIDSSPVEVPRSEWEYRLMIRMPEFVKPEDLVNAIDKVSGEKRIQKATAVEWFTLEEGRSVQIMHLGSFSTEPESLKKISVFMDNNRLSRNGLHHEIYLSDFRKTAPEKLRTILREPVK